MDRNARIYVAGHTGLIGSAVVRKLKSLDYKNIITRTHKEMDLKNWRSNQKNSGFLPEERSWLDELFGPAGFTDAFREVNLLPDQYTWWSNRGQAWAKNVGWRIDYQIGTPGLKGAARRAVIYKDSRFSDHAPLRMDFDLDVGFVR